MSTTQKDNVFYAKHWFFLKWQLETQHPSFEHVCGVDPESTCLWKTCKSNRDRCKDTFPFKYCQHWVYHCLRLSWTTMILCHFFFAQLFDRNYVHTRTDVTAVTPTIIIVPGTNFYQLRNRLSCSALNCILFQPFIWNLQGVKMILGLCWIDLYSVIWFLPFQDLQMAAKFAKTCWDIWDLTLAVRNRERK